VGRKRIWAAVRLHRGARQYRRIPISSREEPSQWSAAIGKFLLLERSVLKKRIIPIQLLLDGRLVKTKQFGGWRDVGDPVKSSAVYNSQYADELIFLNISRTGRS